MADWTDGPEYAPHARPDAFVAAGAPALSAPEQPGRPEPAPAERPDFAGTGDGVPLDQLAAHAPDARDPHAAFSVATTALTTPPGAPAHTEATQPLTLSTQSLATPGLLGAGAPGQAAPPYEAVPGSTTGQVPQARWAPPTDLPPHVAVPQASAWGSAHSPYATPRPPEGWAPQQPLALPDLPPVSLPPAAPVAPGPQVNPQAFPTPDAARWYAPGYPPQQAPQGPVTTKALVEGLDPLVLVCLVAGGLVPFAGQAWVAPALLVLAQVFAAQRARYRRTMVRNAFGLTMAVAAGLAVLGMADAYAPSLTDWWASFCGWSQLGCWVLIPILLMIVGGALRRGEPPEGA